MKMRFPGPLSILVIVSAIAYGQPTAPADSDPITLKVCVQGEDSCAIWTFLQGSQHLGTGQWNNGEIASLHYTISGNTIIFDRADTMGPYAGLSATYTGTIDKDGFSGSFTAKLPGHSESQTGHWFGSPAPPVLIPEVIHFCGANCFTLTWRENHYSMTSPRNSWEPPDYTSTWTVEKFTRTSVIWHRHDSANPANSLHPNGWDTTYKGQIAGNGDVLVNITEDGMPNNKIRVAWGADLDTVPGTNAERDQRNWQLAPTPACDVSCLIQWGNTIMDGAELVKRFINLTSPNS